MKIAFWITIFCLVVVTLAIVYINIRQLLEAMFPNKYKSSRKSVEDIIKAKDKFEIRVNKNQTDTSSNREEIKKVSRDDLSLSQQCKNYEFKYICDEEQLNYLESLQIKTFNGFTVKYNNPGAWPIKVKGDIDKNMYFFWVSQYSFVGEERVKYKEAHNLSYKGQYRGSYSEYILLINEKPIWIFASVRNGREDTEITMLDIITSGCSEHDLIAINKIVNEIFHEEAYHKDDITFHACEIRQI